MFYGFIPASISPIPRVFRSSGTSSALDDVDRESGAAGLFVTLRHVGPGLAHRLDGGIQRDDVRSVAEKGQPGGHEGRRCRDCVALDAGDLYQAADGVAGEPEVVFDGDLRGILDGRACLRAPR